MDLVASGGSKVVVTMEHTAKVWTDVKHIHDFFKICNILHTMERWSVMFLYLNFFFRVENTRFLMTAVCRSQENNASIY